MELEVEMGKIDWVFGWFLGRIGLKVEGFRVRNEGIWIIRI